MILMDESLRTTYLISLSISLRFGEVVTWLVGSHSASQWHQSHVALDKLIFLKYRCVRRKVHAVPTNSKTYPETIVILCSVYTALTCSLCGHMRVVANIQIL